MQQKNYKIAVTEIRKRFAYISLNISDYSDSLALANYYYAIKLNIRTAVI